MQNPKTWIINNFHISKGSQTIILTSLHQIRSKPGTVTRYNINANLPDNIPAILRANTAWSIRVDRKVLFFGLLLDVFDKRQYLWCFSIFQDAPHRCESPVHDLLFGVQNTPNDFYRHELLTYFSHCRRRRRKYLEIHFCLFWKRLEKTANFADISLCQTQNSAGKRARQVLSNKLLYRETGPATPIGLPGLSPLHQNF